MNRNRPILNACLLSVITLTGLPVFAHTPMIHDCSAPVRPTDDQDDLRWSRFLEEISAFQNCVTREADRHQAAAQAHQQAAMAAVDAWNEFVRTSLNAPEDFPWPPEER